jgi:hypothetical protein
MAASLWVDERQHDTAPVQRVVGLLQRLRSGTSEPFGRTRFQPRRHCFAAPRLRVGHQRVDQPPRDARHFFDRVVERSFGSNFFLSVR